MRNWHGKWWNVTCCPTLPSGLAIVYSRCWPFRPSYTPNRHRLNKYLTLSGGAHVSRATSTHVVRLHTTARPSFAIDTSNLLLGLKSRSSTSFVCTSKSNCLTIFGNDQIRMTVSVPPVAISLQFGLNRTTRCNGHCAVKSVCVKSPARISNLMCVSFVWFLLVSPLAMLFDRVEPLRCRGAPSSSIDPLRCWCAGRIVSTPSPSSRTTDILTWYNWQWLSWPATKYERWPLLRTAQFITTFDPVSWRITSSATKRLPLWWIS